MHAAIWPCGRSAFLLELDAVRRYCGSLDLCPLFRCTDHRRAMVLIGCVATSTSFIEEMDFFLHHICNSLCSCHHFYFDEEYRSAQLGWKAQPARGLPPGGVSFSRGREGDWKRVIAVI